MSKVDSRERRANRVRLRVSGTADRPRLAVRFSERHIYAQCINDEASTTLVAMSTVGKEASRQNLRSNSAGASTFGKIFGDKAKNCGIKKVVFDRGYRKYHGCVKAFADAAREAGLDF